MTLPCLRIDCTTGMTVKLLTENPMPWTPRTTAVLMPMISPFRSTNGPPLFPSLIAAFV
jgi:hypothetical protein